MDVICCQKLSYKCHEVGKTRTLTGLTTQSGRETAKINKGKNNSNVIPSIY